MKKKIIAIALILCGVSFVFTATRLKPKASSLVTGKDGLELVRPGESSSSNEALPNDISKEQGRLEFEKGTISHVCYIYIDKNNNIQFGYKDDSVGNKNYASLPYKKDYNLVVFIKQSTSGMIWCEKEISKDMIDKVIEVIKKNDKSYKGCEHVAYGEGEHKFTYNKDTKKEKTVKYRFNCISSSTNNNETNNSNDNINEGSGNNSNSDSEGFVGKDGLELVRPGEESSNGEKDNSNDSSLSNGESKEQGRLEFEKGTISHVCYIYIDKNNNIQFGYKDDSVGNKNYASLPYKKDHNLVVFIKQSTSGMIWCEKELSKDMINKVIEVIKKNDKSYKGCENVAYGEGEHKFTYNKDTKKEKTVKYYFK